MTSSVCVRTLALCCVPAFLTACPSDDEDSTSGQSGTETSTSTGTESDTTTGTSSDTDSTTTDASTTTGAGTDSTAGTGTDGGTDSTGTTGGVADCGAPAELGVFTPSDGDARGFAVDGDTLYVAGQQGTLVVADISDPGSPSESGLLDLGAGINVFRVAVSGNHAFLGLRGDGFSIVDVSNPASMMEVASNDQVEARDVAVADDVMYIPDNTGLRVFDVSSPDTPSEMVNNLTLAGSTETVTVVGQTAYVGSTGAGMLIVDVSSPDAPVEVGHYDVSGNGFVSVDGDLAFVSTTDGLHIVDISSPATPTEVATYGERAHASAASNDRVFVLGDATISVDVPFLSVLDISDPSSPVEQFAAFETLSDPEWMVLDGTRLMFSNDGDDAVHIVDACPSS